MSVQFHQALFLCAWLLCSFLLFGTKIHAEQFPSDSLTKVYRNNVSQGIKPLRISEATETRSLGLSLYYLIDSSKSLTITDIQQTHVLNRFTKSRVEIPNFGFAKPTFWFAFAVQNTTPDVDDWLIEIAYQPLDSIEIFEFVGGRNIRRILVGDMLPYKQRLVNARTYVIPLHFADTLPHTFFVRVNTQSSVQMPVFLAHSPRFAEELSRSELGYGIFFGVMATLILYNLFLFISLKSVYYLSYILYLLGATLYIAVVNGFAVQYLWGDYPRFANYMNIGSIGMMVCGLSVFSRQFLQVQRYAPTMAKALMGTVLAGIIGMLAGVLFSYRVAVQMSVVVNILTILIVVSSGAIVWKRGNISVRYFFLAAALFLTGNIMFVMKTVGALPSNPFTTHIAEIGVMVEGLFFAFALADRYRLIRLDKERAQQEALKIQHEANAQLERKVRERTTELEAVNEEMQRQMVILNDQAVEIEMTNVELQEKNLLLENLNHEKNEFMGIAVHDLKSPLQTIFMNISMVRRYRERMDNEQRDYLFERIEETTRRMHDIITNLLDANAIEMGKVEFTNELFPINKEVHALVDDFTQKAQAKHIRLHFEPCSDAVRVYADKNRTLECVENILSNAVKFSPSDKQVTVRVTEQIPNVMIEVQDEGPGLSDEDKTKLFGKFARLSARPTGGEHSTGLGLSIVKKFVEAMNGEIRCTSELGKGATFTIILPSAAPQE
jgi:signal transduction histidine kinase